jgi:hypothetical protein
MKSLLVATLAAVLFMQGGKTVTGKWDLSADTPHGAMTMGLDLKQDGDKVTGKLIGLMNRDYEVAGEMSGSQLTVHTADDQFAIALTLKADGTMSGHLSSPQGDVACKAARAKKS